MMHMTVSVLLKFSRTKTIIVINYFRKTQSCPTYQLTVLRKNKPKSQTTLTTRSSKGRLDLSFPLIILLKA